MRFTNIKVVLWGIAAGVTGMFAGMYGWSCLVDGWEFNAGALVILVIPWLVCLWRFVVMYQRYNSPEYRRMQQESRREYQELRERNRMLAERQKNAKGIREELARQDRTPVAAVLLSTRDVHGKSLSSTALRGAVGYAIFGTFGAGVGIATAKTKVVRQKATFSVRYESGRTAVRTVEVGSPEYRELAELLVK